MKKIVIVGLVVVAAFVMATLLSSPAMASDKGILVDKASISNGFSAAKTYVQLAQTATTFDPRSGPGPGPVFTPYPPAGGPDPRTRPQ